MRRLPTGGLRRPPCRRFLLLTVAARAATASSGGPTPPPPPSPPAAAAATCVSRLHRRFLLASALLILRVAEEQQDAPGSERRTVHLTRVKLVKPKETLLHSRPRLSPHHQPGEGTLLHPNPEVRKEEKQRKTLQQLLESTQSKERGAAAEDEDGDEAALDASLDQLACQDNGNRSSCARHLQWRTSLQSINEATS